jgi:hypothetical protein
MRNYVNLAVPTMPLLVADKRGAAETKIIASYCEQIWLFGNCRDRQPVMHLFCGKIAWRMTAYVKNHGNSQ